MEEAILRRDFQTFAKLTMQVQLDYITQVYLHDNNTFLCTFFGTFVTCTLLPPHTHLLMYSVRVEIYKGNSLCGYEVDLSPKPLSNPAWTVFCTPPPSHTYLFTYS